MNDQDLKQLESKHIMQTYKRLDLVLAKGKGSGWPCSLARTTSMPY